MGEFGEDIFGIQTEPPTVALESQAGLLETENIAQAPEITKLLTNKGC